MVFPEVSVKVQFPLASAELVATKEAPITAEAAAIEVNSFISLIGCEEVIPFVTITSER